MKANIYLLSFFILLSLLGNAQVKVRFELKDIPKHKDTIDRYFMAGSFNNWKPNDEHFKFRQTANGNYILELWLLADRYEYKITRGSWEKVEAGVNGISIANREIKIVKDTAINVGLSSWADLFKKTAPTHRVSTNVKVLDSAFLMSKLNTERKIWIYLPPSYAKSNKRYPVLYMHDGQNLFDSTNGVAGEWGVDEVLDSLSLKGLPEYIVVGIAHAGADRIKEYNPYDSQYGKGMGKDYVAFLVEELKPYVDKNYRTKTAYKNTAIAGSSMGGLISMYAMVTYPTIFGKAGIFSPAFWVGKTIDHDLKIGLSNLKNHKIYFIAGTLEGKMMIKDMQTAYQLLNPNGINKNIRILEKADGKHSEWFWKREFTDFYKFMSN